MLFTIEPTIRYKSILLSEKKTSLSNAVASVVTVVAFASLSVGREKEEKYPADSCYYVETRNLRSR